MAESLLKEDFIVVVKAENHEILVCIVRIEVGDLTKPIKLLKEYQAILSMPFIRSD